MRPARHHNHPRQHLRQHQQQHALTCAMRACLVSARCLLSLLRSFTPLPPLPPSATSSRSPGLTSSPTSCPLLLRFTTVPVPGAAKGQLGSRAAGHCAVITPPMHKCLCCWPASQMLAEVAAATTPPFKQDAQGQHCMDC